MNVENVLSEIISIESVFPNEKNIVKHIDHYLQEAGFKTELQEVDKGRYNIFAERGKSGKPILLYGHTDTVPKYGDWKTEPTKLTSNGSKLYGLGAYDMKGGMAAILDSVKEPTDRHIKLLFCVDEENISKGAWTAVQQRKKWFEGIQIILSGDPGISADQSAGINVITAGRRGRTVIAIDVEGVSSHGATPEKGVNAISEASKIAGNVGLFQLRRHEQLGKEAAFVRELVSYSTSLAIPDKAHMELDIQLVPPSTVQDAKNRTENWIRALYKNGVLDKRTKTTISVKLRETPYVEPFATNLNLPIVQKIIALVEKNVGRPIIAYGDSVADDNILSNALNIPVLSLAPIGGNEHTANEWIYAASLKELAALYKIIIAEI